MHVLVIGSGTLSVSGELNACSRLTGCTGLLIGQGLKKAGIDCTIFERNEEHRATRDWSMVSNRRADGAGESERIDDSQMMHWGFDSLRRHLNKDIVDALPEAQADPWIKLTEYEATYMPIFNGKTGELVVANPTKPFTRFSRAKLVALLSKGLEIRYGKQLADITTHTDYVTARFADGTTATGDLLIGADSANSFVRSWLLGEEAAKCTEVPMVSYNFKAQYPAEYARWLREQPHRLMRCSIHPNQRTWYMIATLNVHDPEHPEDWVFHHFMNLWSSEKPSLDPKARMGHFKELTLDYNEPFASAARLVEDDIFIPYDRIKYWAKPVLWDNRGGRVTLAGDAAHPMTPCLHLCPLSLGWPANYTSDRAQGLNHAVHDAAELVDALTKARGRSSENSPSAEERALFGQRELQSQIQTYDLDVFERGKREIEASYKQGYAATHWDTYMDSPMVKHGHDQVRNKYSAHVATSVPKLEQEWSSSE